MEKITSLQNNSVKKIRALMSSKKERDLRGIFVCEGLKLSLDGVKTGLYPIETYLTDNALNKYPGAAFLAENSAKTLLITDEVAAKISDTDSSQGIFVIFKKLDNTETAVKINSDTAENGKDRFVLLSSLQDPGNMGAIIRACEAFGVSGLHISADCPDIYSPKALRSSMGGIFRLPICISPDISETISALEQDGVKVYAAALDENALSASSPAFRRVIDNYSTAVLIGNEGSGLSPHIVSQCTGSVIIPMRGRADSLNAATAAGILIWEMTKSRD